MRRAVVLAFGCLAGWGCSPVAETPAEEAGFEVLPAALVERAAALRDEALESSRAYDFLHRLTVEVGPRFAGSPGDARAVAWAKARLEELGFANVRTEPVTVPHWERGMAAARILAPYPQPLVVVALGGSVGTPAGGIEAEVVEAADVEALEALGREAVEGKIAFLSGTMARARDGSHYGPAVHKRVYGPSRSATLGAVAVVIRSVGTSNDRVAHTGGLRYSDDAPRIPAAALSNPDADLLSAQLASGEPVRLHLELGCRDLGEATSANVIGEVAGSEAPEEIVLLAAHLDSWDLGTGAMDDGIGCAVITEAARQIAALPQPPRRTIRVLLSANEEFGLSGGRAYAERHADELADHVAAIESDFGIGRAWALRSGVDEAHMPVVRDLERLLLPLGITYQGNQAFGGADIGPLRPARVPFFDIPQDATDYFDYHHNANDTFDKIDAAALSQTVAAYATFAYVAANWEGNFGRGPEPETP